MSGMTRLSDFRIGLILKTTIVILRARHPVSYFSPTCHLAVCLPLVLPASPLVPPLHHHLCLLPTCLPLVLTASPLVPPFRFRVLPPPGPGVGVARLAALCRLCRWLRVHVLPTFLP
jgi:hypothetical protein